MDIDTILLVNKDNRLDKNYVPENLVGTHEPTGVKVDSSYVNMLVKEVYLHFKDMKQDVLKEGYEIFVDSSYRSYKYQQIFIMHQ